MTTASIKIATRRPDRTVASSLGSPGQGPSLGPASRARPRPRRRRPRPRLLQHKGPRRGRHPRRRRRRKEWQGWQGWPRSQVVPTFVSLQKKTPFAILEGQYPQTTSLILEPTLLSGLAKIGYAQVPLKLFWGRSQTIPEDRRAQN